MSEIPTALPPGITESDLTPGTSTGGTWDEITTSTVNLANHTVTANLDHFSKWAVLWQATTVDVTPVTGTIQSGSLQLLAAVKSTNGTLLKGRTIVWLAPI